MATTYTPKEAAERLKVHPATVRREIQRGNLRCARLGADGRIIRISETELESYLDRNSNTENNEPTGTH